MVRFVVRNGENVTLIFILFFRQTFHINQSHFNSKIYSYKFQIYFFRLKMFYSKHLNVLILVSSNYFVWYRFKHLYSIYFFK